MQGFSGIVIILFFILPALTFLIFKRINVKHNSNILKKSELVKKYEYEMLKLIVKYEKDKNLLQRKKTRFLKQTNYELQNNIFFNENEIKRIIEKLISL